MPLPFPDVSIARRGSATVTVRPQEPVRLRRFALVESPWTPAQRELDVIIRDAVESLVAQRPADPYDDESPSIVAALRAERRALERWREYTGGLDLVCLRIGNVAHLGFPIGGPVPFDWLRAGAHLGMPLDAFAPVATDIIMELSSRAVDDLEYRITAIVYRP